jgi:hypothetical protein
MAEDRSADRTGNKADEVDAKSLEGTHQRCRIREEELGEHNAGYLPVKQEVLPLNGGANGACDRCPAQLRAVIVFRKRSGGTPAYASSKLARHRAVLIIAI